MWKLGFEDAEESEIKLPTFFGSLGAFPVVQVGKNPPAMLETWVQYLGCEDPLEEGMATHSSILA